MSSTRGVAATMLRHCLRAAALPTLAAAVLGICLGRLLAPDLGDAAAAAASSPWLLLPLVVAAAACAVAAAVSWPLFAARRPGAELVQRLQRGPLRGCGATLVGAIGAQWLLTLPVAMVAAATLGAPEGVRAHIDLATSAEPLLTERQRRVGFALRGAFQVAELHLRPLAGPPPGSLLPSRLRVLADGEILPVGPITVAASGQLVRVPVGRTASRLELELVEGNVPLFFPPGTVTAVSAATHTAYGNGLWMATVGLAPTFVAMALACLCGTTAALPTVLLVVGGALFVLTIGGLGPFDEALLHLLRGHWLPATSVFAACLPSLAVGGMAMILAMVSRRRPR